MSPLELRDKLVADLARLRREATLKRGEVNKANAEQKQAERVFKDALVSDMRNEEATAGEARQAASRASAGIRLAEEHAEATERALKDTESDLVRLYLDHFDTFAAEAEQPMAEAVAALLEVEAPLRRAHDLWMKATVQWAPMTPAIKERVVEGLRAQGIVATDIRRINAQLLVPPFPLPAEWSAFAAVQRGALVPRPPALALPVPTPVEVTDAAEEAF